MKRNIFSCFFISVFLACSVAAAPVFQDVSAVADFIRETSEAFVENPKPSAPEFFMSSHERSGTVVFGTRAGGNREVRKSNGDGSLFFEAKFDFLVSFSFIKARSTVDAESFSRNKFIQSVLFLQTVI